jgi:hypothetical protein
VSGKTKPDSAANVVPGDAGGKGPRAGLGGGGTVPAATTPSQADNGWAGGVGVARDTVPPKRHCFNPAGHNQLVSPAHYPLYKCSNIVRGTAQGPVFNISWALLMLHGRNFEAPNDLVAKCPVLANLPTLAMHYLHEAFWCGCSGGMPVANGGAELPDVTDLLGMLTWLCRYTDGEQHACAQKQPGGIKIFSCLQLAGSSLLLRASPHIDHRYGGQKIIGCCVVWVSFTASKHLQESAFDQLPDEEHTKLLRYGQVECFFSFFSKDAEGKCFTQDMALIRKMQRLRDKDSGTLLATCADMESNPKGTKMLQVINVQRILADAVLVKNERHGTIPHSWKSKLKGISVPDGITADSSAGKGDGSSLWQLPVHVRRRHG